MTRGPADRDRGSPVPVLTRGEFLASLRIVSGRFDPGALTLYTVMRDEAFFLPAFLDHYRGIGVRQFLILDDGSEDGGAELLAAQPDVVLLRCPHRYGEEVALRRLGVLLRRRRTGIAFKELAPDRFFRGRWALYADADEFLLLPPDVRDLGEVVARLEAEGAPCCAASVVETFPEGLDGLAPHPPAGSLTELVARYPLIEPHPVLRLRPGRQAAYVGPSKTQMLHERYGIAGRAGSARYKTPLVRHAWPTRRRGSHKANRAPSSRVMLTMLHLVFTAEFRAKIERARAWRAHVGGAASYDRYEALLAAMERAGEGFAAPTSVALRGPRQLAEAGLMRWPAP